MKIYELIKQLNSKKVVVRDSRIMEVKRYYLSLYRAYMVYLYDRGYISDPTVFNVREIHKNILDMGISSVIRIDGKVCLDEAFIEFALAKSKDEDEKDFLSILRYVIKYRNMCLNIDKFYDDSGFCTETKRRLSLNLVQAASRVYNKNGFVIDEGVLKCFSSYGAGYSFISLDGVIYNAALRELGINEDTEESLFVSGLSREEEIKSCEIILNGLVELDGKYGKDLKRWLGENKWSLSSKFSSQKEGLYNWLLYCKSNDAMEEQSKLLNHLIDEGYTIVSMCSNGFYVENNDKPVLFPVGIFCVMSSDEEDTILPARNILEGYTGEVYSVEYLDSHGLRYVGCPIELYINNKEKIRVVDIAQTELNTGTSWFSSNSNVDIEFVESSYLKGIFEEDSMEDKIYHILCEADSGDLIGEIDYGLSTKELDSLKKTIAKKVL